MMKPFERIKAMVDKKEVDRPGVAFWKHFPLQDRNVEKMIKTTTSFQLQFESDFIKVCHNGLYSIEDWGSTIRWPTYPLQVGVVTDFSIKNENDWIKLRVNDPNKGALKRELDITEGIVYRFQGDVPVLATIFSPLTTAIKMSGEETLFHHIQSAPEAVHEGLEVITETTIQFVRELIKIGIDGVFFATQLATFDRMTAEQYEEFGQTYDLQVLDKIKKSTWFNIAHIHGLQPMFEKIANYPVQAINWHDRTANVTLEDAKNLTDKILIGGLEENQFIEQASELELQEHIEDALHQIGEPNRLIIAPGCVMNLTTKNERFALTRSLVNKLAVADLIKN